jgi:hypothetical protein
MSSHPLNPEKEKNFRKGGHNSQPCMTGKVNTKQNGDTRKNADLSTEMDFSFYISKSFDNSLTRNDKRSTKSCNCHSGCHEFYQ